MNNDCERYEKILVSFICWHDVTDEEWNLYFKHRDSCSLAKNHSAAVLGLPVDVLKNDSPEKDNLIRRAIEKIRARSGYRKPF